MMSDIADITNLLKESIQQIGQIKAFVFGSASRSSTMPGDIDILVIYNDPVQPRAIRQLLKEMNNIPIHLIFLTIDEEVETNFITSQRCISIL